MIVRTSCENASIGSTELELEETEELEEIEELEETEEVGDVEEIEEVKELEEIEEFKEVKELEELEEIEEEWDDIEDIEDIEDVGKIGFLCFLSIQEGIEEEDKEMGTVWNCNIAFFCSSHSSILIVNPSIITTGVDIVFDLPPNRI